MENRFYFNQGRCARLNLSYTIYQESQPQEEVDIEVGLGEFISVMYELDDEQYNRALQNVVTPALISRLYYLFFEPVPSQPGYFDVHVRNNNAEQ